jgi:hypothetical protein
MLGEQMAEFKFNMAGMWSNDGTFEKLREDDEMMAEEVEDDDDEENEED